MSWLEIDEVVEKLRPSFSTFITMIDESLNFGKEAECRVDQEYVLVMFTPRPLGIVFVHLKPHLEGDRWANLISTIDTKIYEPSMGELKRFYASSLVRILCVCAKVGDKYWMNLLVKTRVTKMGVICESKVVNLGG